MPKPPKGKKKKKKQDHEEGGESMTPVEKSEFQGKIIMDSSSYYDKIKNKHKAPDGTIME